MAMLIGSYTVTRDGQTVATFDTEGEAWGYLLRIQGQSIDHAVRHEGYDIIYPNGVRLSQTQEKGQDK